MTQKTNHNRWNRCQCAEHGPYTKMAIYLTTSGRGRLQHTIFSPCHHFSPDFLGTCVHYYYICNVNILTPVHAPPDCHNAVGAHDHFEPPCFRHCRKQRELSRYPTLQIHRQRTRPHPRCPPPRPVTRIIPMVYRVSPAVDAPASGTVGKIRELPITKKS